MDITGQSWSKCPPLPPSRWRSRPFRARDLVNRVSEIGSIPYQVLARADIVISFHENPDIFHFPCLLFPGATQVLAHHVPTLK